MEGMVVKNTMTRQNTLEIERYQTTHGTLFHKDMPCIHQTTG